MPAQVRRRLTAGIGSAYGRQHGRIQLGGQPPQRFAVRGRQRILEPGVAGLVERAADRQRLQVAAGGDAPVEQREVFRHCFPHRADRLQHALPLRGRRLRADRGDGASDPIAAVAVTDGARRFGRGIVRVAGGLA